MQTLHVIAGPNGAGKTTLYRNRLLPVLPGVEFVNADELALREYGRAARTLEESARGQDLADRRRTALMAAGRDLVTESTFSHPSKVDLVRAAKADGYKTVIYHVNVREPDLSVLRVAHRVEHGGHAVPEDKIRERYLRNQPFIREAARIADRAYVFDNSRLGEPHELSIIMAGAEVVWKADILPEWVCALYAEELAASETASMTGPGP